LELELLQISTKGPMANGIPPTEKWIVPNPRFPPDAKKEI
jgi:hypothetical protein